MIRGLSHLPWRQMFDVLRVFAFGAWKHRNDLWCDKDHTLLHFHCKAKGHIDAWWVDNEHADHETGLHPLAHAICDLLIAWALSLKERSD